MPRRNCGKMTGGCSKSENTYHKCKKKIQLTIAQDRMVAKGGRINGRLYTDFCEGHVCEFCHRKF